MALLTSKDGALVCYHGRCKPARVLRTAVCRPNGKLMELGQGASAHVYKAVGARLPVECSAASCCTIVGMAEVCFSLLALCQA